MKKMKLDQFSFHLKCMLFSITHKTFLLCFIEVLKNLLQDIHSNKRHSVKYYFMSEKEVDFQGNNMANASLCYIKALYNFTFFSAGTPYAGGLFKMKLVLGKNFPQEPPKGFFTTKIFHPNVAKNGEICVNTLKRDWKAEHGIKHILLVIILSSLIVIWETFFAGFSQYSEVTIIINSCMFQKVCKKNTQIM